MAVRSRRLFGPQLLSIAAVALYTVPALRTVILRQIVVSSVTALAATPAFYVNGTAVGNVLWLPGPITGLRTVQFVDDLALNPGDVLYGATDVNNNAVVFGSGSLLEGAPS